MSPSPAPLLCCAALLLSGACIGEITYTGSNARASGGVDGGVSTGGGGGGGGGQDDGPPAGSADARPVVDGPETECGDLFDDDGDGATDCDDSDCAGAIECTWPTEMNLDLQLAYTANDLARLGGYDDCLTRLSSAQNASGEQPCGSCDRAFRGAYNYVLDSCPPSDRPVEGAYALRFVSDNQREVYVLDDAGWQLVGMANASGGSFTLTRTDPVLYEGSDAGALTTTMTFTDR